MTLKVYIGKAARDRKKAKIEEDEKHRKIRIPSDLEFPCEISFGDLLRTVEKVVPELSTTDRERWNILMNELGYVSSDSILSICKSKGLRSLDDWIGMTDKIAKAEKGKLGG